jgi:small subunit ribosomal protein S23
MGGKQIRPARVYKSVLNELQNDLFADRAVARPPWLDAMSKIPPSETLVRVPPVRHSAATTPSTGKPKKLRNLYRPQRIVHPEDKLRATFFRDHPWELARPRIIVESDGKDYQRVDWSKGLRQPGMQLSGES